ncbi:MAG: DUF4349 domain-containing protein [Lachnospiraceae bacterium]|nr:DUF4349 domain-containing protein [Lachnospiraceae bacterium]
MKKKRWITGLLAMAMALAMTACGSPANETTAAISQGWNGGMSDSAMAEDYEYAMDSLGMAMSYPESEPSYNSNADSVKESDAASQQSDRKLIRTVNMSVETKEYDAVMGTIEQRISELGGYIEKMDSYNGSVYSSYRSNRSSTMTARIPSEQMDVFLGEVSEISNVTRRSENVQDVTLDYVDMASHKKTLQAEHDRLLEFLEQAESIEDIITIEQRLSNVQYQIESMESQLRTYDNKVDYGTVYLEVNEVQELTPVVEEETLWDRISSGFANDLKRIENGALEILVWLLVHIPTLVMWTLIIVLFVLWVKWVYKRSLKKAEKKQLAAQNTAREEGGSHE